MRSGAEEAVLSTEAAPLLILLLAGVALFTLLGANLVLALCILVAGMILIWLFA